MSWARAGDNVNEIAVRVVELGKRYRLGSGPSYKTLRDSLAQVVRAPVRTLAAALRSRDGDHRLFWALKDVSLEVRRGEVLGIIGRNGAGKSTLLKILSRITEPTEGYAEVHGRTGSLLEVGTGFHPELTGRENVYLNGIILGMRRSEVHRRFSDIVDFSGIEKFIDTPVKHYSSGMFVRLGFSVAAHLEPEILIVDEVLAVGDVAFQERCLGKMAEVAGGGRTVLFVSHNMSAISALCQTAVWLDGGRVVFRGSSGQAIARYIENVRLEEGVRLDARHDRKGTGWLRITHLSVLDGDRRQTEAVRAGQPVSFVLEYAAEPGVRLDAVTVNLVFADDRNYHLFSCMSELSGTVFDDVPSQGRFVCSLPELPLLPGRYELHFSCLSKGVLVDKVTSAAALVVVEGDFFGTGKLTTNTEWYGSVLVRHNWSLESGRG